jgi:hypothetical protein
MKIAALALADRVFQLRHDESREVFEDDLELAWVVDTQLGADHETHAEHDERDQAAENKVIRNVEAKRRRQRVHGLHERGRVLQGFHGSGLYLVSQGVD